jgi:hypothetical protein
MVEDVPGDPARGVAGRPALGDRRRPVGRLAQHRHDRVAQGGDRVRVVDGGWAVLDAEPAGVARLRPQHVVDHLVAVAAAAAWALAQLARRAGDHLVEQRPRRGDQRGLALCVAGAERLGVGGGQLLRDAEVGRPRPGQPLDHPRGVPCPGREGDPGPLGDRRVARGVGGQRLQRQLLGLAGAAPAGPVERAGEDALPAELKVHGGGHAVIVAHHRDRRTS